MKYQEKDFTLELKSKINDIETSLQSLMEKLLVAYKPVFTKKGLELDAAFEREGNDPFDPGYCSAISIGITDKRSEELIDLHTIKIWECGRYFLGIQLSTKIPGSKIVGELVEESVENIKAEVEEYFQEQLTVTVE